ncbi:MAG TPA: IS481 family transposase, partial [Acidobacteriota bacterium]
GGTVQVQYPGHYEVRKVSHAGAIRWRTERIFLTTVLAYEYVGLEALDDGIWSIYLGNHFLARLDERSSTLYT